MNQKDEANFSPCSKYGIQDHMHQTMMKETNHKRRLHFEEIRENLEDNLVSVSDIGKDAESSKSKHQPKFLSIYSIHSESKEEFQNESPIISFNKIKFKGNTNKIKVSDKISD
jgi:hypothetical protein